MARTELTAAAYHLLLALVDGDAHGYALMQSVSELSDGSVSLGPGTLYGTIRRLLEDGLIVESDERPDAEMDDRRRRYYRITEAGRMAVTRETARMAALVRAAQQRGLLPSGLAPGAAG